MQETLEKSETAEPIARHVSMRVIALGLVAIIIVLAGAWVWWTLQKTSKPAPELQQQSAALPLPALAVDPIVAPPGESEISEPVANALAQTAMRLAAMESELAQLKNNAAAPSNSADMETMKQLDNAVRALSNSLDAVHISMTAINARLAALETIQAAQPLGGEAKRISYALGLRELERALNGSGPFQTQLETVAKLLDPGVAQTPLTELRAFASSGLATRDTLAAQFDATAAAIVRADSVSGVPQGWAGRTYAFVLSLIMIRPLGERPGDDVPSLVARAQTRLEAGDFDAAVTELNGLKGAAAGAAAPWLTQVRARLQAEQALAQLNAILTEQLNAIAAPAPSTSTSLPGSLGE